MREWAAERIRNVRDSGLAGVVRTRHDLTEYALRATLGRSRSVWGPPVYGRGWDSLVVSNDLETLLETVDADRVVVTSDHGNTIGECGTFGHHGVPLDVLRRVPWVETDATDTGSFEPSIDPA